MGTAVTAWLQYVAFRGAQLLLASLPLRAAGAAGRLLGGAACRLGVRRRVTTENLRHAFPDMTDEARARLALGAYRNYGTAIAEFLWTTGKPEEVIRGMVRLANPAVVRPHLADPRGLLIVSGHFGSWELIISALRLHLGRPFATIVQTQRNRRVDAVVNGLRTRFGNVSIPMGPSSGRELLKVLKQGGMIGALGDQSAAKESIYVEFFGRPAATHRGVAALALRTGAPIVMVFLVRAEDGRYDVHCEEVPHADLKDAGEEAVLELTRRHTAVLESWIRRHPDHWLWMHKRWKHTGYYEAMQAAAAAQGGDT
jgi:KDO2-lipid IV(A) lauroyltransferase